MPLLPAGCPSGVQPGTNALPLLQIARHARGRHAITHGLLAIGHGDTALARRHADTARRLAGNDPLALLLHAQSAQLEGNRDEAQRAFRAMAEREDTRLLGLRGLFIEAQRADDAVGAVMIAEEAIRLSPSSTWASHAVLGFRCARGDWSGALAILDSNLSAGLIDKQAYRRQRGVLLTARALELETMDRDVARESVMEAIKLAPTLVPAAVLAAKFESEAHQVRRAMKLVEAAWLANPHPDLADAYAHVKLGDSARQRLQRVETLAAKTSADKPGHVEGQLAIARVAIDASEFARAREVLAPYVNDPTQRVALLMAEIERAEHGDSGRARAWTLRAVRGRHEGLARQGRQGFQDTVVQHLPGTDLLFHHVLAGLGVIDRHGRALSGRVRGAGLGILAVRGTTGTVRMASRRALRAVPEVIGPEVMVKRSCPGGSAQRGA